jgi:hypothetical protein
MAPVALKKVRTREELVSEKTGKEKERTHKRSDSTAGATSRRDEGERRHLDLPWE